MSDQVIENRLRKKRLEILGFEEEPAGLVIQRKAIRPAVRQIRGDHSQVDRPRPSGSSCRGCGSLNRSAGSVPQILEGQRVIERLSCCRLDAVVQPFDERRLVVRNPRAVAAGTQAEAVWHEAVHEIAVKLEEDEGEYEYQNTRQRQQQKRDRDDRNRDDLEDTPGQRRPRK